MKFQVYATSGEIKKYFPILLKYNLSTVKAKRGKPKDEITINSLEELIKMINELDEEVIVYDGALEIYDDYRE